ncbi:MAG: ureidoglycolate lyase, partial [Solirubrobacteraceae bacterium]
MYLMRIGAPGAETPAARVDDESYVDLSDVVQDFDEAFFGAEGVDRIRP